MLAGVAEWQTRTFKGRVGDRVGSSPTTSTKQKGLRIIPHSLFCNRKTPDYLGFFYYKKRRGCFPRLCFFFKITLCCPRLFVD